MKKHFLLALLTMLPFLGAWAGDVGTFDDLKAAFEAGGDVKLTADIEVTDVINVSNEVKLDLNGQTITVNAETVTSNPKVPFIVRRGGKFTVEDNSVSKSGTIDASNLPLAIQMCDNDNDGNTGDAAELIVNGGILKGKNYVIVGRALRKNVKVTVNGGTLQTVNAEKGTAIFNAGDVTINGGVIEGQDAAVELNGGSLTINGGTFNVLSDTFGYDLAVEPTTKGAAIALVKPNRLADNNNWNKIAASITGGTFNGKLFVAAPDGEDLPLENTKFVSGGTFPESADNMIAASYSDFLVPGCDMIQNANGTSTVEGYDLVLQLGSLTANFGDPVPPFLVGDFTYYGIKRAECPGDAATFMPTDFTKQDLYDVLTFVRVDQSNNAGAHAYTVTIDESFKVEHPSINTVKVNNGNVNFLPRSLNDALVTFNPNPIPDQAYTGDQIKPEVKVLFNGTKLVENTDYTVTLGENILPATGGTITFNGINNFTEQVTLPFNIIGTNIADNVIVQVSGTYTYNGEQQRPVAENIKVYQKGDDGEPTGEPLEFTIKEYGTNVNAGPGRVTVTLGGIYSGDAVGTFTIDPKSIAAEGFTVEGNTNAYYDGGTAIERNIVLKDGEKTLEMGADKDFTVEYANNKNAGTATVTITGVHNYKDAKTVTFTIYKRYFGQENNFDWSAIEAVIEAANKVYNGEAQTIDFGEAVPVLISNGKRYPLTPETDYTISYDKNTNAGTATVIFTGAGDNYESVSTELKKATKEFTFQIAKKPVTIAAVDFSTPLGADLVIPEPKITTAEGSELTDDELAAIKAALTYQYSNGLWWNALTSETSLGNLGQEGYTYRPVLDQSFDRSNYEITIVNARLTIAETEFIAKVVDATMNYGGRIPNFVMEAVTPIPNESELSWAVMYAAMLPVAYEVFEKNADDEYVVAATPYQVGKEYIVKAGKRRNGQFITGTLAAGNYVVSVNYGKLTVNPVSVDRTDWVTVSRISAQDYTGEQIKPEVTVTDTSLGALTVDKDYTIEYGENINAGTGTIIIKGIGNYTGERTVEFTINKINLDILADNLVGEKAQSYSDVLNNRVKYKWSLDKEDLVEADKEKTYDQLGMTGDVTVSYHDNAVSVGMHAGALYITGNNVSFTNYVPTLVNGDIEIKAGEIVLEITSKHEITYGETFDPATVKWAYKEGDLSEAQQESLNRIISGVTFEVAEDVPAVAIGDEAVTYKPGEYAEGIVGKANSTNYAVTVESAKLIVKKAAITLTAIDQTIDQGETPSTEAIIGENVELTEGELVGEDELDIELEYTGTSVGTHEDAIDIKVKETEPTTFYEITVVKGDLTVAGAEYIELARAAEWDNSALLADYAGQKVSSVSIKGDVLKKDWWYTLTLPFATTAMDIADAFGYVVVDVPDLTNKDVKKVAFELAKSQEIPANTMILIKMYRDRDLNNKPAVFEFEEETEIVYEPGKYLEDAAHNKYFTLYANKSLDPTENANCWYLYEDATQNPKFNLFYRAGARSSAWNVASLGGYFESASADPDAVRVYVQDEDGTITAIKAMDINPQAVGEGWYTVDGMKLDAAPTQKGVYINNGKKVVVK